MNLDDQDPPVHRISRVEEREKLLAEAMAHAEAQEAQYKVIPADEPTRGLWKAPLALTVLAVAGVLAVFPPGWVSGPPPPTLREGDLERGLRAAIFLQASQVKVYRLRNGYLPDDLEALPNRLPDLGMVKSNNRVFQIMGRRPNGEVLVYDSAHPAPGFAAMAAGWISQEAP